VLREVEPERFFAALPSLRTTVGDRAVARALHFYRENERVSSMVGALVAGRIEEYVGLMADSGRSSGIYLQNCAPSGNRSEQSVVIALAQTERYCAREGLRIGRDAACRVHGGGFAGTIQVLLPASHVKRYRTFTEEWLAPGAVSQLTIRSVGAVATHG
jgi:galactokinase